MSIEEKRVQITLEVRQARVLIDALDMYLRMGMGHLEVAVGEFLREQFYERAGPHEEEVMEAIQEIKRLVFSLEGNGSWGIRNEKVPLRCREAADIEKVLRFGVAQIRVAEAEAVGDDTTARWMRMTCDFDPYSAINADWPPIEFCAVAE